MNPNPTMNRRGAFLSMLLAGIASFALGGRGEAQTTWTATTSSGWSTASNWSNGVPLTDGSEAVTITGGTAALTSTIDSAWSATGSISGLTINPNTAAVTLATGTGVTAFTIGAGGVTIGASSQTVKITAPLTLSASQTWNVGTGSTLQSTGTAFNAGSGVTLTKTGAGSLQFTTATAINGNLTVNQGTVQLGIVSGTLASFGTGTVLMQNNGATTLQLGIATGTMTANSTFSNNITFADQGTGGGTFTLGTGAVGAGKTLTLSGNLASSGTLAQKIVLNGAGTNGVANIFSAGTVVLSGDNSGLASTAGVAVKEGIWVLDSNNALGTNNGLAVAVGDYSNSVTGLAALLATSGHNVTAALATATNNSSTSHLAEFGISGTGSVTFSGNLQMVTSNSSNPSIPMVYLAAASGGTANFSGVISDTSAASTYKSAVIATGGGRVVESGANTYGGGTYVYGGTALVAQNTSGSASGTGAVTVGATAVTLTGATTTANNASVTVTSVAGLAVGQTVSGTGIVAGSVIIGINATTKVVTLSVRATATGTADLTAAGETGILGGTGIFAPGGTNGITVLSGSSIYPGVGGSAVQTLTMNGLQSGGTLLTMQTGSTFTFNLGASNTSDTLKFINYGIGDLVLNSNALNFSNAQEGTFTLFQFYSNAGTTLTADGLTSGLVLGTGLTGYTATLNYDASDISLTLVAVAVPEPSTWLLLVLSGGFLFAAARRRSVMTAAACSLAAAALLSGGALSQARADDRAEAPNLLINPGFEEPKKAGWIDNNWAKLEAEYAFDDQVFHAGRYSKRMTLKEASAGNELQEGQWPLDLKGGTTYRVKYWIKGSATGNGKVDVTIRDAGAPYATYGTSSLATTEEWKEGTFDFTVPAVFEDKKVGLYISFRNAMTIWIDDASLTVVSPASN
ncbi:PEP-CTERM protein-sorting domain-containing protein [Verrucomicrobium sp. GAS474]|uniref:carbohydrate binding domain-containing protein n=1 Tax=Verrucomicrobium sp. GAS474 TaxID=1882831 RepID=UPI00087CC287|nr:carbohydrate binding domain-containing protein [Verrucomicrobium sp. GAS474]SDT92944.1 PEP-CTERM protein-sorting domain-containing protein [Verrucomicrobium sp. GAS474]